MILFKIKIKPILKASVTTLLKYCTIEADLELQMLLRYYLRHTKNEFEKTHKKLQSEVH